MALRGILFILAFLVSAVGVRALPVVLRILLGGISISICSLFIQKIHPLCCFIVCKEREHYTNIFMELMELDTLPPAFLEQMRDLLGEKGVQSYLYCMEGPPYRGIRINPLKCTRDRLESCLPFRLEPAPFSPLEFYLPPSVLRPGRLPPYHAGAFYVQEPSASSAVTALDPKPGEKILDLCAAPGGKSTQIAGLLGGEGLLWANDVNYGRTAALISNLERMGTRNAVVSCCRPEKLCSALAGFFDRVLVDAPCSEEGMFRRSPEAVRAWSPAQVKACAARQEALLYSALKAVRKGGILEYSTCTFSPEEDEGVVSRVLRQRKDFEPICLSLPFGRPARIKGARRIYPMDGGEGHFLAVLRRTSPNPCEVSPRRPGPEPDSSTEKAISDIFRNLPKGRLEVVRGCCCLLPDGLPELSGLGVLRAGIPIGRRKKGHFLPEHAAFAASNPEDLRAVLSLQSGSPSLSAFLRGEEIPAGHLPTGYAGVAADGMMTGFGKCSGGFLKNHYPKGLRNHF